MYILADKQINDFLTGIKGELIAYMQAENRNSSGRSAQSLQVNVSQNVGRLTGAEWIEFVFRGRTPGRQPPIDAIIDWCNSRGLPRGMAWGIAKKIAKQGTELYRQKRNILNEVITEDKISEFAESIIVTFKAQINSEIKTILAAA